MISNISSLIWSVVIDLFDMLVAVYNAVGLDLIAILVGIVAVVAVYNYVLSPLLNSGSSDKAKKNKKGGGDA